MMKNGSEVKKNDGGLVPGASAGFFFEITRETPDGCIGKAQTRGRPQSFCN
jgi:hypothetical protein